MASSRCRSMPSRSRSMPSRCPTHRTACARLAPPQDLAMQLARMRAALRAEKVAHVRERMKLVRCRDSNRGCRMHLRLNPTTPSFGSLCNRLRTHDATNCTHPLDLMLIG
eukprot:4481201-Prymnesium_polylepis.1